ncbi:phage major capsid protein [Streptomyces pristinaespiralis]|uniref:phage major capsid protein n=1 Tax=Streptomyces pristinaespiralis TaxID=38300 RepID=UPI0033EB152C
MPQTRTRPAWLAEQRSAEPSSVQLRQQRHQLMQEARGIYRQCEQQQRDLTAQESTEFERLTRDIEQLTERIETAEAAEHRSAASAEPIRRNSRGPDDGTGAGSSLPSTRARDAVRLERSQSMADHVRSRGYTGGEDLSFDRLVRGMLTGTWIGADAERRALSEGVTGAGGVLVPTPLAAQVLDLARAQTRVMQAGASTVPMETQTLKIARQTGDPTLAWHTEAAAIAESDLSFDSITLTAKTLPCLIKASIEVLEDVDNLDNIITNSVAKALALELDRVALRGSGTDPEPRGLRNTSGITVTDLGAAAGLAPTWDHYVQAVGTVRGEEYEPNAAIHNPRTETDLSLLKDGQGQYLQPPAALAALQQLTTTQVPIDLTHGTATDASEAYIGDWSQLIIGMRTSFSIRPLTERYVDTGEVGFFAYLRADVAVAHPEAFNVLTGIIPAA